MYEVMHIVRRYTHEAYGEYVNRKNPLGSIPRPFESS